MGQTSPKWAIEASWHECGFDSQAMSVPKGAALSFLHSGGLARARKGTPAPSYRQMLAMQEGGGGGGVPPPALSQKSSLPCHTQ